MIPEPFTGYTPSSPSRKRGKDSRTFAAIFRGTNKFIMWPNWLANVLLSSALTRHSSLNPSQRPNSKFYATSLSLSLYLQRLPNHLNTTICTFARNLLFHLSRFSSSSFTLPRSSDDEFRLRVQLEFTYRGASSDCMPRPRCLSA